MTCTPNDAAVERAYDDLLTHWYAMGKRRPRVEALIAAARAQGEREAREKCVGVRDRMPSFIQKNAADDCVRAIDAMSVGDPSPQKDGG